MKRGTPDHPKTKRLVRFLRIPIYSAVGLLEMLFHWTAKHCPRGDVGRFEDDEIAEGMGWHGEGTRLVEALHRAGYLDVHPEHRWVIHDWQDHADEAVKKLLKRQGLAMAVSRHRLDVSGRTPVMSRLPEPEPIPVRAPDVSRFHLNTSSDTFADKSVGKPQDLAEEVFTLEPLAAQPRRQKLEQQQRGWFDAFYAAYWRKRSPDFAWKTFKKIVTSDEIRAKVMAKVDEQRAFYMRKDPNDRPYPATWLNAGGWKDEPDEPAIVDAAVSVRRNGPTPHDPDRLTRLLEEQMGVDDAL
jgi:hypothetical protein